MNVGFDLDKVFISFPPLVPHKLIELLYKGKSNRSLKYRIPSKIEQSLRIITHHPVLRQPIKQNLEYLRDLSLKNKNKYFLISSRFSFLRRRTSDLVKRHHFDKLFNKMYFNYSDNQPHEFKNRIIKKLKLSMYIDDDLSLLTYLAVRNPKIRFFWLNDKIHKSLRKNLFAIKHLSEMFT